MDDKPRQNRIHFWAGILVSALCFTAIFIFIKPADIFEALSNARFDLWALVALSLIAFMLLRAVRWRFMLRYQQAISYQDTFHIQNIGYMLTNILPFRLGDVARAVLIGNLPNLSIGLGLSTIVVERVLDLLLIVIVFPFTLVAIAELPTEVETAITAVSFISLAAFGVLIFAANRRSTTRRFARRFLARFLKQKSESILTKLDDLLSGLDTLMHLRDSLVLLTLSVLVWLPIFVGYYIGLIAANIDPTWLEAAFVVCIAAFSVAAPSSPGQLGVFEASVTLALVGILGKAEPESASFAIIYHVVNYLVLGVLGAIGITQIGQTLGSVIESTRKLGRMRHDEK